MLEFGFKKDENEWLFTQEQLSKQLPSHVKGLEEFEEFEYRKSTCFFIELCGKKLKLPQLTIATAEVYFHRFYTVHSFQEYDRFFVGTTCLFLAGKAEETPKKLEDVLLITQAVQIEKFSNTVDKSNLPKPKSDAFEMLRKKILQMERILLQTLHFDIRVQLPYESLDLIIKRMNYPTALHKKLKQKCWNFINDSLRTKLCLEYPYYQIGAASVILSSIHSKIDLPQNWGENIKIGLSEEEIFVLCRKVLKVYDEKAEVLTHFRDLLK